MNRLKTLAKNVKPCGVDTERSCEFHVDLYSLVRLANNRMNSQTSTTRGLQRIMMKVDLLSKLNQSIQEEYLRTAIIFIS